MRRSPSVSLAAGNNLYPWLRVNFCIVFTPMVALKIGAVERCLAHIGVLAAPAQGHMYPSSTLALELKKRGHRITFFVIPDAADFYVSHGLSVVVLGQEAYPLGYMDRMFGELAKLKGRAGLKFTIGMVERDLGIMFALLPQALQSSQVDALIVDQIVFSGSTVAEFLKIPYVHLANALLFNGENGVPPINFGWPYKTGPLSRIRNAFGYAVIRSVLGPVRKSVNAQRVQWGLEPCAHFPDDLYAARPQISQLPPSLEYPRKQLPADFHFVGPLHNLKTRPHSDFPWEKLDGRPILYASMGTLMNQLDGVFRTILKASENLDVQLVLTLGGGKLDPASFSGVKGNPVIVKYAPQLEILKLASVCITAGGLNTINEALAHGVPLVAIPITNDEPAAAARIEWSGVGKSVHIKRLTVARLRAVLEQVLVDPAYRENARRIQKEIAGLNALEHASQVVESVLN
jgi:zeaxanthin glucosyltransferase